MPLVDRGDQHRAADQVPDNDTVSSAVQFGVVLAFTTLVMLLVIWRRR